MNLQHQPSDSFPPPPGIPLKRKRGRPRKDKSQTFAQATYVPPKKDQTQNHGGNAPIPPGFERANESQPRSVDIVNDNNNEDPMVGQVVTGVIESVFEAGYLLSVRIGDSDTSLRGVVFKAGHYVPVTAENDVAPSLRMITRNEVPFPPSVNRGHKRRGKSSSPREMPIVPFQSSHPVGERGTMVPVVLQPVNLSNGSTPIVEPRPVSLQPAHLAASKSKQAQQSQTDSGSGSQPFEDLVSAAKRIQGSPQSGETQSESGASSKMLSKDSGVVTQDKVEDFSKPLVVKPLQAIRSSLGDQTAPVSHNFPERRTGKMTELLLAVQENLMERQMAESPHQNFQSPEN